MPLNTPNLALKIYNSTTDASATFATYRSDQAGISPTSNMNLIDSWVGKANASLVSLTQIGLHYIRGNYVSSNYYEATSTTITSYIQNMFISLSLNTANDGTVGLNINGLGTVYLKRYDIDGNLINFENAELKKNRGYIFRYNGTYWVLVSANLADQISASGINQHLIMISPCGVLIDSGISASSVGTVTGSYAPTNASYVVLSLNSGLSNEWLLTAGSNITLTTDSSTSTLIISSASTSSGSFGGVTNASYVVLSLHPDLTNEWLLTAGSNITLTQEASSSAVIIHSTAISSSIISGSNLSAVVPVILGGTDGTTASSARVNLSTAPSTGSYVVLSLNNELSNEWLLTAGSNIILEQDSNSSSIVISSTATSSSIISGSSLSAPVPISMGGTDADTESGARNNLNASPSTASYLLFNSDSELSNGLTLTAGSNITLTKDSSASTLIISASSGYSSGVTNASYVVLELNPDLTNDWLLTAGSGISLIKDTDASTISIHNNFFVDQSGSSVKTYGAISGSISGSNCDFIVSNQKFDTGTLLVYLNGQLQTQGSDDDWVETSASLGVFSFITAPLIGDKIICQYLSKG